MKADILNRAIDDYKYTGSSASAELILASVYKLLFKLINRYGYPSHYSELDAFNDCVVIVLDKALTYDVERCKFSTYIYPWIKYHLMHLHTGNDPLDKVDYGITNEGEVDFGF